MKISQKGPRKELNMEKNIILVATFLLILAMPLFLGADETPIIKPRWFTQDTVCAPGLEIKQWGWRQSVGPNAT